MRNLTVSVPPPPPRPLSTLLPVISVSSAASVTNRPAEIAPYMTSISAPTTTSIVQSPFIPIANSRVSFAPPPPFQEAFTPHTTTTSIAPPPPFQEAFTPHTTTTSIANSRASIVPPPLHEAFTHHTVSVCLLNCDFI